MVYTIMQRDYRTVHEPTTENEEPLFSKMISAISSILTARASVIFSSITILLNDREFVLRAVRRADLTGLVHKIGRGIAILTVLAILSY